MAASWVWVPKASGAIVLETADGLPVMDCVRKSMHACVPRFPNWPGAAQGQPRADRPGVMSMAHAWLGADGRLSHPYAVLIAAAPELLDALLVIAAGGLNPDSLKRALSAISKATGSVS